MATDYRSTVFLPRSGFPMKANLPRREPEMLARWREMGLYERMREERAGRERFTLHDGPPYANGHLHIGHALNKILKDVINRSQQMLGKDVAYVPGWDCHGLPIEWMVEESYRAAGKNKDEVPIVQFRRECREFAEKWIAIQSEEFQRLGVEGDWDRPYLTMSYDAEAQIVRELGKFLMNGSLYRGSRPILWSVVERTALADAEVEYEDHTSTTIHVRFPVLDGTPRDELRGASVIVWTTTPWTMPGNRAIAVDETAEYVRVRVTEVAEGSRAIPGEEIVVAGALLAEVARDCGITGHEVVARLPGRDLVGTACVHPLRGQGYDFDVPVLAAGFVTMDQGTGCVHIAPGHGADDFHLGLANGIEVPFTVDEDGTFLDHVPLFARCKVLTAEGEVGDADGIVVTALEEAGGLLARGRLRHSYPHSWRSKAPLIFRNTAQWFISMSKTGLRETALSAIEATRWVPAAGRNRIESMVDGRPDWCISRQRAWGVPIPVFVHKRTGEPLRDQAVIDRAAAVIEAEGADAWFSSEPARFLGNEYDSGDYEQVRDIAEVWFESGSTHSFVLEARDDLDWPASLYLEGSDQHRGWFQSSLLESCGTRGRAPFDAVLTHGFVMAEDGRKMSKSLGNVVSPQEVIDGSGAEILRLWVVGSDYSEDLRIGPEILKHHADVYRRLRNTLRFMIGNLDGFGTAERLPLAEMPELDRWVLHRLWELDSLVRRCCVNFDFHSLFTALHTFCVVDLSAFYFDIRKDALYCDPLASPVRRAARTALDEAFRCLVTWLAPVLCFTAEEAWLARDEAGGSDGSVHLAEFPTPPAEWRDDALAGKWRKVRALRRVVTGALELERAEKRIGASMQAHPIVHAPREYLEAMAGVDLAEIAITSGATLVEGTAPTGAFTIEEVPGVAVVPGLAAGEKCERCWKVLPDVGSVAGYEDACARCADAVERLTEAAD